MMCMWEHIDRTNLLHVVFHAKQAQIAGLCCRVTTYINDTLRFGEKDGVDYIIVHPGTWRISNNNIRTAMLVYEICRQDIFHVSGVEQRIVNLIQSRINFGIFDCFRYVFDADYFLSLAGNEVGYRSGTGIKVVNHFITG